MCFNCQIRFTPTIDQSHHQALPIVSRIQMSDRHRQSGNCFRTVGVDVQTFLLTLHTAGPGEHLRSPSGACTECMSLRRKLAVIKHLGFICRWSLADVIFLRAMTHNSIDSSFVYVGKECLLPFQ